jgi:hypothetical protein
VSTVTTILVLPFPRGLSVPLGLTRTISAAFEMKRARGVKSSARWETVPDVETTNCVRTKLPTSLTLGGEIVSDFAATALDAGAVAAGEDDVSVRSSRQIAAVRTTTVLARVGIRRVADGIG